MEINIFPSEGNVTACGSDDHQTCNPGSQKKYSLIMRNASDVINTTVTKFPHWLQTPTQSHSVELVGEKDWHFAEKISDKLITLVF